MADRGDPGRPSDSGRPHRADDPPSRRAKRWRRGGPDYYIASAPRIAGKKRIDLRIDPPPDLAIEAVISHPVKDALEAYRRLQVPEVWVCDGKQLRFLVLQSDQTYAESPTSAALPFVTSAEILNWVQQPEIGDETAWRLAIRHWVETELAPRQARKQ